MKNEVSKELESRLGSPLPSGITFSHAGEKTVRLTLGSSAVGLTKHPMNMQQDAAAFEAWALALHTYLDLNLVLDAKLDEPVPGFVRNGGHFSRFLYRALRFSEQYGAWFSLSEELKKLTDSFASWLAEHWGSLVGNTPKKEAGNNEEPENQAEATFAETQYGRDLLKTLTELDLTLDTGTIHRQLPVGLFLGSPSNTSRIFTGSKSAIDLWGLSEDRKTLAAFELKYCNTKMGLVTELFFYANYMSDLINGVFLPGPGADKASRGYPELNAAIGKTEQIYAYMLADGFHPLISESLLEQMNDNAAPQIRCRDVLYNLNLKVR